MEIYLDEAKKSYYYSDFIDNVLMETSEVCKLNDFIKPYLKELNESKKIQSIFSKFPGVNNSGDKDESYLTIAYTEDIKLKLEELVSSYFSSKYNNERNGYKFSYNFWEPKDNCLFDKEESKFKLGCICNPDYFRINHLKLTFKYFDKEKHKEFWADLTNKLKEL